MFKLIHNVNVKRGYSDSLGVEYSCGTEFILLIPFSWADVVSEYEKYKI